MLKQLRGDGGHLIHFLYDIYMYIFRGSSTLNTFSNVMVVMKTPFLG